MSESTFTPNGYSSAAGTDILSSTIIDILSSDEYAAGLQANLNPLGIVTKIAVAKDQVVTGMTGSRPVEAVGESQPGTTVARNETYKKAIEAKEYVAQAEISRQMLAWIEKTKGRPANDPSVAAMLADMKDSVKFLGDTLQKTMNVQASRLYGMGSSITAASGAGSASPDGKALFADDHRLHPADRQQILGHVRLDLTLDVNKIAARFEFFLQFGHAHLEQKREFFQFFGRDFDIIRDRPNAFGRQGCRHHFTIPIKDFPADCRQLERPRITRLTFFLQKIRGQCLQPERTDAETDKGCKQQEEHHARTPGRQLHRQYRTG